MRFAQQVLCLPHSQPGFASHPQKSQILTASVLPPLKHPQLVLSFWGKIIPTNTRWSWQIINLKGLSGIWLGLWVYYNGTKIQKMSCALLLFQFYLSSSNCQRPPNTCLQENPERNGSYFPSHTPKQELGRRAAGSIGLTLQTNAACNMAQSPAALCLL